MSNVKKLAVQYGESVEYLNESFNLHQLIQKRCRSTPDSPAVTYYNHTLTYRDIELGSNQVARMLLDARIGEGDPVAVLLDKGVAFPEAVLGILKAGGYYVPIDPEYPDLRIASMLKESGAKYIVTEGSYYKKVLQLSLEITPDLILNYDAVEDKDLFDCAIFDINDLRNLSAEDVSVDVAPDSPAYMIFTSGTTGRPKGVINSHGSVLNLIKWYEKKFKITQNDRLSQLPSFSFDASISEIFSSLALGSHLVIFPSIQKSSVEEYIRMLVEYDISFVTLSPTAIQLLFSNISDEHARKWKNLRMILSGGEPLRYSSVEKIYDVFGEQVEVVNIYGPTEATVFSTVKYLNPEMVRSVEDKNAIVPIGAPVFNEQIVILDEDHNPVPTGESGELCIGGAGLAIGYYGDPERTADVFITTRLREDVLRLYRTGDCAKITDEGEIHFIGRLNDQVKIRGYRVELADVEENIRAIEGVKDSVVVVKKTANGSDQLCAYCALNGAQFTVEELRSEIEKRVPDYMVPSLFVFLDRFPMTTSGKVDKSLLPEPLSPVSRSDNQVEVDSLSGDIANAWVDVLKLDGVTPEDNFYQLGGDSISAIRVVSILTRQGYQLRPVDLLKNPTVPALSDFLRTTQDSNTIMYESVTGEIDLSPIQKWFFSLNLKHPEYYHQSFEVELSRRMDPDAVKAAVIDLVNHHDMLRSTFYKDQDGSFVQRVMEPMHEIPFELHDLTNEDGIEEKINSIGISIRNSIRLEVGPLMKLAIVHLPQGRSRLIWAVHHLIVDTVSWYILMSDFQYLYEGLEAGRSPVLPARSLPYAHYSRYLKEKYSGMNELVKGLLDYWQPVMKKREKLALPAYRGNGHSITESMRTVKRELSLDQTINLTEKSRSCYSMTVEEMVLTALYRSFASWASQEDIVFDLEWNGRGGIPDEYDVSRTVGWFTSIAPFYLKVSADESIRETLIKFKEAFRAMPDHGLSFNRIRRLCDDEAVKLLFENYQDPPVIFNYSGVVDQLESDWNVIPISAVENHAQNRNPYEIACESYICDGSLVSDFYFANSSFDEEEIGRWADLFMSELKGIIEHTLDNKNHCKTPYDFKPLAMSMKEIEALPFDVQDVYPLSELQQAMCFYNKKEPSSSMYHVQVVYKYERPLNVDTFHKAFQMLVDRHDLMRASFSMSDFSSPAQIIRKKLEVSRVIVYDDLSELTPDGQKDHWSALLENYRSAHLMSLEKPPLFRINLMRTGKDHFHFILTIHHGIHDGISLNILMNEFEELYSSLSEGKNYMLPALTSSYKGYVDLLHGMSEKGDRFRNFWSGYMSQYDPVQLPYDHSVDASNQFAFENIYEILPRETVDKAREISKKYSVSMSSFFLGALMFLLGRLYQNTDIAVGMVSSTRDQSLKDSDRMFGCFINTVPVRMLVDYDKDISEYLAKIHEEVVKISEYSMFPLSQIRRLSSIDKGSGSLFDVIYIYESYPLKQESDRTIPYIVDGYEITNYPMSVNISDDSEFFVKIMYNSSLYDSVTIKRYMGYYLKIIGGMIESAL